MTSSSLRRKIVLFLALAILTVPAASSAGPRSASRTAETQSLLHRAWSFLTNVWSQTGCHLDPDGRCLSAPPEEPRVKSQADEGCHLDPSGGCLNAPTEEPRVTSQADEGCHLDPDGRCRS